MQDAPDAPLQTYRKGTKSCIECRARKVKCTWPSETANVCAPCAKSGRTCAAQIYRPRAAVKVSSRERISRLEQQLANIAARVHEKQTGHMTSPSDYPSSEPCTASTAADIEPEEDEEVPSSSTGPAPLRLLFDIALTDLHDRQADVSAMLHETQPKVPARFINAARERLQLLVPPKETAAAITTYAMSWMHLYTALYPPVAIHDSVEVMFTKYEQFLEPTADPVQLAAFLLLLAISAHQLPPNGTREHYAPATFVRDVSEAVEATILSHDSLSSTLEGIELTILYLRLQLGRGRLKSVWLQLRKTIALAEFVGLPRVASRQDRPGSPKDSRRDAKTTLWQTLCATDRMSGIMLNLPMATTRYRFPRRPIIDQSQRVDTQAFIFELVSTAVNLQDIDDGYATGEPQSEIYEQVLRSDRRLRCLASSIPKTWWQIPDTGLLPEYIIQCFYHYIMARFHLHCAMQVGEDSEQFAYSRICCMTACRMLVQNYTILRPAFPVGIFIGRIFDMQCFTAVVYLCLARYGPLATLYTADTAGVDRKGLDALISQAIHTMSLVSDRPGAEFARDAAPAVQSLKTLLEDPSSTSSRNLTLRVPLVGKIHIGRRTTPSAEVQTLVAAAESLQHPGQYSYPSPAGAPQIANLPTTNFPSNNSTTAMPWMMELDIIPSFDDPYLWSDVDFNQLMQAGMNTTLG